MSKKKRILVFGYFGYVTNQLDGQTVKTRAIFSLLKDRANAEVVFTDTQEFRSNKQSIFRFFKYVLTCNKLVILPCLNNLKYLFPPLFILSKILRFDIIHVGIGGWHKEYLAEWPVVRNMMKRIRINLLENTLTCQELKDIFGFENIGVIPNFREYETVKPIKNVNAKLKLVFMARINLKKGLDTLAKVLEKIEKSPLKNHVILDLFGPIESELDKQYLNENIVNRFEFANYVGRLEPKEIFNVLSGYDLMLFPTHYFTEGCPGSILDAYRAGVPVIATEWKHAHQFITDNINGYIVDFENPVNEIFGKICYLNENRDELAAMQGNAYKESLKYLSSEAWKIIGPYLEDNA